MLSRVLDDKGGVRPTAPMGACSINIIYIFTGRYSSKGTVRPTVVIALHEELEEVSGVGKAAKLVFVQTFIPKLSVEALDKAILRRLAWGDKAMLNTGAFCPFKGCRAGKLGPVVGEDRLGRAPKRDRFVHGPRHPAAGQRGVGLDPETCPSMVVDDVEQSQRATIGQTVVNEVHAPSLIRSQGNHRLGLTAIKPLLAFAPTPHLQPCL